MEGFDETGIESFYVTFQNRIHSLNDSNCNGTICQKNYTIFDEIKITAIWCKFNREKYRKYGPEPETLVKFGGIFSSDNVFSDNKGCPDGYLDYPFFHNLKICMSQFEIRSDDGYRKWNEISDSAAFGGIITCHDKFAQCPQYYSRYLATTIDGCSYYYCARVGDYPITSMPTVRKPPYIDRNLAMSDTRFSYRQKTQKFEGTFEIFQDKIIE
uniref:Uncharacterized protein n=1 Tax=Panagrolaimus davidi TaxID=227884 RepID=A0A914P366_9BILA